MTRKSTASFSGLLGFALLATSSGRIFAQDSGIPAVKRLKMIELVSTPRGSLFAVGNPDVFHLDGVIEEPAAFPLLHVEPVDGAAFVGEGLLEISCR